MPFRQKDEQGESSLSAAIRERQVRQSTWQSFNQVYKLPLKSICGEMLSVYLRQVAERR